MMPRRSIPPMSGFRWPMRLTSKDAADILLRERTLAVLHQGILERRKAFANENVPADGHQLQLRQYVQHGGWWCFCHLPMLPMQILLNNFLYDLAQVTIPTDNVDASAVRIPQRWDIRIIRNFMLGIGPLIPSTMGSPLPSCSGCSTLPKRCSTRAGS